jgi:hypothetical protein
MANAILTVSGGDVTGLKGTTTGDVPTWSTSTNSWTAQAQSGGGGGSAAYTTQTVAVTSATGLTAGKIVAWDSSNGLVLGDNTVEAKTHVAGVVDSVDGTNVTLRTSGTVVLADIGSATRGTAIYLDTSGNVDVYANIASGEYIVLLGYVSNATNKEIILNTQIQGTRA